MKMLDYLLSDLNNDELPKDEKSWQKLPNIQLRVGQWLGWWYKEDLEYEKEYGEGEKSLIIDPPYMGIVIPAPDAESHGWDLDEDGNCVVVIVRYPTEKCNPEVDYVALRRLLNDNNLEKIVVCDCPYL